MNPHAHDRQSDAVYVIHVHRTSDGYRASVRKAAGDRLDVRTAPTLTAGHGTAATAPAAILAAVVAARIPAMIVG